MSVCSASKVTRRIISVDGPSQPQRVSRHNRVDGIMGHPEIKDSDKFKAAVSQEETRLRNLHPTPEEIPSCMSAFDDFLSCNSTYAPHVLLISVRPRSSDAQSKLVVLGTQLKSIYRFGEMAHCSAKWNEFKFCMSIKGLHPEQRRDAWIRHRAEWWARRRLGLSSENVWEMRAYVRCLITTTVPHRMLFQRTVKKLPATFTPTRGPAGSCRINLNFWAKLQPGIAHPCLRAHFGIEVVGMDVPLYIIQASYSGDLMFVALAGDYALLIT